jgi:hypothetical protein
MRSFFKLPGTALLAVAALFAVAVMPSTANAFTFRADDVAATLQSGPASVQKVASYSWWEARRARRDVARALRNDCRSSDTRSQRRECFREAWGTMWQMSRTVRRNYRECRSGSNRWECRQQARAYWVDQAASYNQATPGEDTPPADDGPVTDDIPQ